MSRLESLYIPKEALELVVDEGDHQPISLKEYLDAYMEQGSPVTFSDGTIRMDLYRKPP